MSNITFLTMNGSRHTIALDYETARKINHVCENYPDERRYAHAHKCLCEDCLANYREVGRNFPYDPVWVDESDTETVCENCGCHEEILYAV